LNLLNLLLILPLAGFLVALLLPKSNPRVAQTFALVIALVSLALAALIAMQYNAGGPLQFETNFLWVSSPDVHYHVGIDGINLWLVVLTALLTPIAIALSTRQIKTRANQFYALILLLEFGLIGVFSAFDIFLFYVFFEVTLVPMYLMVGIWGGERRIPAAIKFFLYTLTGSVLMLAGLAYLYTRAGTLDYPVLVDMIASGRLAFSRNEELLLFLAFFAAFAVKIPLFPLHSWLPETYTQAPPAATMFLSALMVKMGALGVIRFCLPLFPNAARQCAPWILVLAVIGILYGALVSMVQPNFKTLIAYSSLSHLGFVVLGIFSFTQVGLDGAVYQMINHGISTGALFVMAGMLEERRGSQEISAFGGIAKAAPWFSAAFLIASLASMGLPSLNNFVGEFLILQGAATAHFTLAAFATVGVILSAAYMLWMYQRVFFGVANSDTQGFADLRPREWMIVTPLVILMGVLGVYTAPVMNPINVTAQHLLDQGSSSVPLRVQAAAPLEMHVGR
jgi:NADH-quinone oxidoreductase subunit M